MKKILLALMCFATCEVALAFKPATYKKVCFQGEEPTGCYEAENRCAEPIGDAAKFGAAVGQLSPKRVARLSGTRASRICRDLIKDACPNTSQEYCCLVRCSSLTSKDQQKTCLQQCVR